jgi:hypothetical protein
VHTCRLTGLERGGVVTQGGQGLRPDAHAKRGDDQGVGSEVLEVGGDSMGFGLGNAGCEDGEVPPSTHPTSLRFRSAICRYWLLLHDIR